MTKQEAEDYLYEFFKNTYPKIKHLDAFALPTEFIEARNIVGEDTTKDIYQDTRPEPNTWDDENV
jgi:hypothetical protein